MTQLMRLYLDDLVDSTVEEFIQEKEHLIDAIAFWEQYLDTTQTTDEILQAHPERELGIFVEKSTPRNIYYTYVCMLGNICRIIKERYLMTMDIRKQKQEKTTQQGKEKLKSLKAKRASHNLSNAIDIYKK